MDDIIDIVCTMQEAELKHVQVKVITLFLEEEKEEILQDLWIGMHISRDAFPLAGVAYKRALKSSLSLRPLPLQQWRE